MEATAVPTAANSSTPPALSAPGWLYPVLWFAPTGLLNWVQLILQQVFMLPR